MRDALHPRAQGPYRDRARGLSRRHHRRAARLVRAAIPVAGRASTSTTAPAMASAAICRCTKARPASPSSARRALKRGMILSNEPGYYKAGAYGIRIENLVLVVEAAAVPGAEKDAQCVRDADARAHRSSAGRGRYAHAGRDGLARRLSCARRADTVAARRRRDARVARGRHPPARAKLNPLGRPLLDPTTKGPTSSDARPRAWRLLALLIAMTGIELALAQHPGAGDPQHWWPSSRRSPAASSSRSRSISWASRSRNWYSGRCPTVSAAGRSLLAGLRSRRVASTAAIFVGQHFERPSWPASRNRSAPRPADHRPRHHPRSVRPRARRLHDRARHLRRGAHADGGAADRRHSRHPVRLGIDFHLHRRC